MEATSIPLQCRGFTEERFPPTLIPGAGSGRCWLLPSQQWFSVKREVDCVLEEHVVTSVGTAGCYNWGRCFWHFGGGGQGWCSTAYDETAPPPPAPRPAARQQQRMMQLKTSAALQLTTLVYGDDGNNPTRLCSPAAQRR